MNKLIKIIFLLIGGLVITCFALILLPLLLIVLMLWMIFGGTRMRVFKGDKKNTAYEYETDTIDATFSEAPPEPEETISVKAARGIPASSRAGQPVR